MTESDLQELLKRNPAVKVARLPPVSIPNYGLHKLERQALARFEKGERKKGRRIEDPANPYEETEHEAVAAWLTANNVEFHHSPNGGMRPQHTKANGVKFSREAQKLQRLGTKAGFPDILIIDRPPFFPGSPGAVVEMKRRKGGTLSSEQKEMIGKFAGRGWRTFIAKGADAAIEWLQAQGYGRRRE